MTEPLKKILQVKSIDRVIVKDEDGNEIGEAAIDVVMSTATEDRDRDTIDPKGIKTGHFERNPVFLWAHNQGEPPIGKVHSPKVGDGELRARIFFDDEDEFAMKIFRKYQRGFMNAVSIGFMPIPGKVIERGEGLGFHFEEIELTELSAVPVPSNREALVVGRSVADDDATIELLRTFARKGDSEEVSNVPTETNEETNEEIDAKNDGESKQRDELGAMIVGLQELLPELEGEAATKVEEAIAMLGAALDALPTDEDEGGDEETDEMDEETDGADEDKSVEELFAELRTILADGEDVKSEQVNDLVGQLALAVGVNLPEDADGDDAEGKGYAFAAMVARMVATELKGETLTSDDDDDDEEHVLFVVE